MSNPIDPCVLESAGCFESADPAARLSRATFGRLSQFITSELGIKMADSKISMIQSRLLRRVRELGMTSIDDYCEHLFSVDHAGAERVHFINAITTNKTDFFREPQHFHLLTSAIIPSLEESKILNSTCCLNVWSAPCSSGEEPYSLAMILSDFAASRPRFDFRILGTDVSTKVLEKARAGIYSEEQIEPIPDQFRRRYLMRGKDQRKSLFRVVPRLREAVSFHQLNFMQENYRVAENFHVIFCRNVLIYFDKAVQESVVNKLCRNLVPGGYMFIGQSESVSSLSVPLLQVENSCFRKPI